MARKPEPEGSNAPSPEEREQYFLSAVRKHDALTEQVAAANKARSTLRKELKTMGFKMKTFDRVLGEREIERKEIKEDLADEMRMRRWLQLPTGEQASLFPREAMPVTEDAAYLDGFTKGVAGKGKRQPPEEFSSGKQQQSWLEGWDAGQAKVGADFFGKKDYAKIAAAAEKPAKAEGPSGKQRVDPKAEKAKKDADNVVQMKPPGVPEKATNKPKPTTETPDLDKVVKAAAKKKPTKAEEAAKNGGVGGLAPPGARKGGGDFDDDDLVKPAAKATAVEDDDDLGLEDEDEFA